MKTVNILESYKPRLTKYTVKLYDNTILLLQHKIMKSDIKLPFLLRKYLLKVNRKSFQNIRMKTSGQFNFLVDKKALSLKT